MKIGKPVNRTAAVKELFGIVVNAMIQKMAPSQRTEGDHEVYGDVVQVPQGFRSLSKQYTHPRNGR